MVPAGRTVEPRSLQGPHCPRKAPAADAATVPPANPASSSILAQRTGTPKQRPKGSCCPASGESEAGRGPRSTEASCGLSKDIPGLEASTGTVGKGPGSPPATSSLQKLAVQPSLSEEPTGLCLQENEGERLAASADTKVQGQEAEGLAPEDPGPKAAAGESCSLLACTEPSGAGHPPTPASVQKAKAAGASGLPEQQQSKGGVEPVLPRVPRPRGEELQQRATEAVVCAKNIKVSSTGEKVVLWTRYVPRR